MARWLMLIGAVMLVIGAVLHFYPGLLSWFGKLPGDIHMETAHGKIFIPITSMIVISLVLTLLLNLFRH